MKLAGINGSSKYYWLVVGLLLLVVRTDGNEPKRAEPTQPLPATGTFGVKESITKAEVGMVATPLPDKAPARAVCDSVAKSWEKTPLVKVSRNDETYEIRDRSPDQPSARVVRSVCQVLAYADQGLPDKARKQTYWAAKSDKNLRVQGWASLFRYDTDGPNAYERRYQRGLVQCQRAASDGGKGAAWQAEETVCWSYPRKVVLGDTI